MESFHLTSISVSVCFLNHTFQLLEWGLMRTLMWRKEGFNPSLCYVLIWISLPHHGCYLLGEEFPTYSNGIVRLANKGPPSTWIHKQFRMCWLTAFHVIARALPIHFLAMGTEYVQVLSMCLILDIAIKCIWPNTATLYWEKLHLRNHRVYLPTKYSFLLITIVGFYVS